MQSSMEAEVKVHLPKFRIKKEFKLKPLFTNLGMADHFIETTVDLSSTDGTRSLFVYEVFHKALVDINEKGTGATAAT